jgi:hypothetical protein
MITPTDSALSGTIAMASIDELAIPANVAWLPTRDGSPPTCWQTVSSGALALDRAQMRFVLSYTVVNSCTGAVLNSGAGATGTFTQTGDSLAFKASVGEGNVESFGGHVTDALISAKDPLHSYTFRR